MRLASSIVPPSLSLLIALVLTAPAAPQVELERISPSTIEPQGLSLEAWSYTADEAAAGAHGPQGASEWRRVAPTLRSSEVPGDWSGLGWFRLDLEVAPSLSGKTVALRLHRHHGASRVYLDGELVAEIGLWSRDPKEYRPSLWPEPIPLAFRAAGRHELLVRFANPDLAGYRRVGYFGGFAAWIGPLEVATARLTREQRLNSGRRSLYASVFLSFALLHLLLWAFRRQSRENLYFALLSVSLAVLAFLLSHKAVAVDPRIVFWTESLMNAAGVGFALFGVLFVHRAFSERLPPWLSWLAPAVAGILAWGVARPSAAEGIIFLTMLAGLVEMGRAVLLSVKRGVSGALIVALGIFAVVLGFGAGLLALLGVLPQVALLTFVAPFASVLLLIVSMSIYLARRVALTHADLEAQLERVRRLSEEKVEQERRAGVELTQRRLLEAEVETKRRELEEARELQLSMLPRTVPEHPELDIAAHMKTATEVGGDYYDFDLAGDGSLTIAIGDATGHGLRAGTMVTATKSLFNALAQDEDLVATVSRSNSALKRMNLRSLNMALLLARYKGGGLRMAAAGMPFPLIHRGGGELESVEISGMPLGSMRSFPYKSHQVELRPGDTVLLMSDGFPELLNPAGEMLGYDRAGEIFRAAARDSAAGVVERLVAAGEQWRDGRELEDDVTFVVVGVR